MLSIRVWEYGHPPGRTNPQTTTSVIACDSPSPCSHKLKIDFRKMKDAMKFEGQSGWGYQPGVEAGGSELVWSIYVVSVCRTFI